MRRLLLIMLSMLMISSQLLAQNRTISGRVTAGTEPLVGVSVTVPGTNIGVQTNSAGSFSIVVPANAKTLEFSFVGYKGKVVPIGSTNAMQVALEVGADSQLEEVVVGAGGIKTKKRTQGYASTNINSELLTATKPVNVAAGLSGKVAGLQVNSISSGVNPTVRLVLRGNRSLLGDNTALLVIDNVIVPSNILSNLNPEDIEDINILNGANAAALYGTDASNGAVIVTTKKGKNGHNIIKFSQSTTLDKVSFYPKLQNRFGSGSEPDVLSYTSFENQQYGPAYNGQMVQIGRPLLDGSAQMLPYAPTNDREKFWETGVTNQTDVSLSSGDERSTSYISAQYATITGTTPNDKYNRFAFRANGSRNIGRTVKVTYNTYYVQNRYDITTQTASVYEQLLNTPANIPLTKYKNWQSDPFAKPEGYYNDFYSNPYFTIDNNRQKNRNDYLQGLGEFNWKPINWLDLTYRVGISTRNQSNKNTTGIYIFENDAYKTGSKADVSGSVSDGSFYSTQVTSDFLATIDRRYKDFTFNFVLGQSLRNNSSKTISISSNGGLVNPDLYNISNINGTPSASESNSTSRQVGVFGKFRVGYKNYLFLNLTGRNDWVSVLAPKNQSFFYPAADVSFIPTDAFDVLRNSRVINNLKLRAGVSKVGNVNISPYSLTPTFSQASGFPFALSGPGFTVGNRIVSNDLKPEFTQGWEAGFDVDMFNSKLNVGFTYYSTSTTNQTVPTGVSRTTGYSSYLQNTGEVTNLGAELMLHYTAIKNREWKLTLGGNYTYNENKVVSISSDVPRLQLSTGGSAQVYAVPDLYFPVLIGTAYKRDPQGRIIVDAITGYPSQAEQIQVLGNTNPKHRLGLDLELKYKGLRLWTLFEYRGGYVIYNNGASTYDFSGSAYRTVMHNRDRFVIPNSSYEDPSKPGTYIQNTNVTVKDGGTGFWASSTYNRGVAENYVYSGDFWKLRELSISYDVPQSVLGKTKVIKSATISLHGRNLLLWVPSTNLYTDPEYNFSDGNAIGITTLGQTPPTRNFGATVSLTF